MKSETDGMRTIRSSSIFSKQNKILKFNSRLFTVPLFFRRILETGTNYASMELPPSWFVKASAIWGECLNYRGEGTPTHRKVVTCITKFGGRGGGGGEFIYLVVFFFGSKLRDVFFSGEKRSTKSVHIHIPYKVQ